MTTKLLLSVLGAIIIVGIGVSVLKMQKSPDKAGPVACTQEAMICPDGSAVGRTGPNCEFTACPGIKDENPNPQVSGGCFIGGCSSQICSDQEGIISTCEYREEYACYKTAKCERQANGVCGWTETPALKSCLSNNDSSSRIAGGYVSGHVTIGPFCPVESADHPCNVPDEAYTSREAVIYQSNGYTVRERMALDKKGNYKIALGPGKYFAQIQPAGIGPGEKKPFTVISFETTTVDFDIDTGIR